MTLSNQIESIFKIPSGLDRAAFDQAIQSEFLQPDVELLVQRVDRKEREPQLEASEVHAAENFAIVTLNLCPDQQVGEACLQALRDSFKESLKLSPSQISQVLGAAKLKAFNSLPAEYSDIITALPFRTAYEMSKLEKEEQMLLIEVHFARQEEGKEKPNLISKKEVLSFRAKRSVDLGQEETTPQPAEEATEKVSKALTDAQLLEAAPDIKGAVFAEMLRLKIEKAFKQDPTPQLANQIQAFAEMLVSIAGEIEDRLQDFG